MYIALLNIVGTINNSMVSRFMPVLDYIQKKNRVRGLLLVVNSGGGDANATQILYNKLLKIAREKPVYTSILGVGASGAYWLSCASEKIFAMETSIIGSIGVISISLDISELLENIGIKTRINKIGKYKDINSPFRKMTDEENSIYNNLMNDIFLKFREEVQKRRKLSNNEIDDIATGLLFSSLSGKQKKLVDEIGDTDNALDDMKRMHNLNMNVKNLTPKKGFVSRFIGISTESFMNVIEKY